MWSAARVLAVALVTAPSAAAGPVVAVLDPDRSDRVALLEAKLLADPGVTLVDRAAGAAALKEQELSAAFGPQGVAARVRLGAVLKADVLVFGRSAAGAKGPAVEMVVSETAGGLRLRAGAVPVTADPKADAAALVAVVRVGLAKHGETVREVVAVPPFLSGDLSFDRDHLKGAFARLAEGEALGRPGVVVVELAEAEAVAKELALAAPGGRVNRPPPLYLLGEYRHDGKPDQLTVTLRLRADRGGVPVGAGRTATVPAADASAVVRGWAAGVFDAAAGGPRPAADPRAEAKRLAARAAEFRRVGNTADELALCEASLLVDPHQPAVREHAARACAVVARALSPTTRTDVDGFRRSQRVFRRGLEHVDAFAADGGDPKRPLDQAAGGLIDELGTNFLPQSTGPQTPPAIEAEFRESRERQRELALRLVPVAARQGRMQVLGCLALYGVKPAEKYVLVDRVLASVAGAKLKAGEMVDFLTQASYRGGHDVLYEGAANKDGFDKMLDRVLAGTDGGAGSKDARAAAAQLKTERASWNDEMQFRGNAYAFGPPHPGPGPDRVRFTKLALAVPGDPSGASLDLLVGAAAAGPGVDALWTRDGGLFLVKEPGVARPVWRVPGSRPSDRQFTLSISTVRFDGRLLWVAVTGHARNPLLIALDPVSEKVWPVTAADGLPEAPAEVAAAARHGPSLLVAPLDPGRACVGGCFGRGWAAVVTVDPATGAKTVTVVHEAREQVPPDPPKDAWKNPRYAFHPAQMVPLRSPTPGPGGKPAWRVLIARALVGWDDYSSLHPLVLDPDGGPAQVYPKQLYAAAEGVLVPADGAAYFVEYDRKADDYHVGRIGFPGLSREVVARGLPRESGGGSVLPRGDRFVVTANRADAFFGSDQKWWTTAPGRAEFVQIASRTTACGGLIPSSRHGMLTLVPRDKRSIALALYAVEVLDPPAK